MPTKTNKIIVAASALAMLLLARVTPAEACDMPNPWPPIGPCDGYDGPYERFFGDCRCDGFMVPGVPGADCPGMPCHDCFWPHQGPRAGDPR